MRKEDALCVQVSQYLQARYPDVIYHFDTSSGGNMQIGMAVREKQLNPHRGYPDLFIVNVVRVDSPVHSCRTDIMYNGLFIELKAEGKSPFKKNGELKKSKHLEEQNDMLLRLQEQGYKAVFATGFDEAKQIIDDYLGD